MDPSPVESLEAAQQHRTIVLVQNVTSDLDDAVRARADEVLVVGGVVKLAERKPVRSGGLAALAVGDDVGSVKQLTVPQSAERALRSIGTKDPLPERSLMNPDLQLAPHAPAPLISQMRGAQDRRRGCLVEVEHCGIVELNREDMPTRIISDHKDRPCGKIQPGNQAEKVDERDAVAHEFPEARVVAVSGIGAPVRVDEPSFPARAVVVRWSTQSGWKAEGYRHAA